MLLHKGVDSVRAVRTIQPNCFSDLVLKDAHELGRGLTEAPPPVNWMKCDVLLINGWYSIVVYIYTQKWAAI